MSSLIIFIFLACVENEAYSFERFNFLLSFQTVVTKNRRNKWHFFQVLAENIMIFVIVNDHVNNFDPTMQSLWWTDKKIILIEDIKDIMFELFCKTVSFFYEKHSNLTCTIYEHTVLSFVFYHRQNQCENLSGFFYEIGLTVAIKCLKKLIAYSFQYQECINSAINYSFLTCKIIEIHIWSLGLLNFP